LAFHKGEARVSGVAPHRLARKAAKRHIPPHLGASCWRRRLACGATTCNINPSLALTCHPAIQETESGAIHPMKKLLALTAILAIAAFAADIAGTWKATAEGPNGAMERTFVFKVDGNKLTGETTSSMMGKSTIMDGKVDGDSLSFSIMVKFQDNEMKVNYKGKVSGNDIKLTAEIGDSGQTLEWVGKRVS
jgi:hypothetical protein